ncbi:RagB/SusD family nutrient uptake outer membrane protein [Rapidithrix thailandica]|uniref:RagB/SusD family nutrient uptake outer membrane protein n=1 Tax=Rapidithrix thailandica TaxID=413964 RepID=A0AAW9S1M2_9BACT
MKNRYIKSIVGLLIALLLVTGCGDSFLEQPIPGKYPEEDFYKTDEDVLLAVTNIYDLMSAQYYKDWNSMVIVKMLLSDNCNAGGSGFGDQPGYQALDDFNTDAANDKVRAAWKQCYEAIYDANKVVNNVQGETALRKRLIAEAKVLRAFNYFDLVVFWGEVPLITQEVDPADYTKTTRAPKADSYALIEKDLQEAISDLPLKSAYGEDEKFRVAKGTAQALLGKVYLYQEKWANAAEQFEEVINSGEYSLESSVAEVFSKAGEFGAESLFELSFTSAEAYDWGNFPWDTKPESNIHIQLIGPRSDFYVKAPADSLIGGWGFITPKESLYNAYVAAGDESRRKSIVMSETELKDAGGNWTNTEAHDYEGFFQRKYGTFAGLSGDPVTELNYGTNFRILRYADVLLMAAEANYEAGNEGIAQGYLNQVRSRPGTGLPDVMASGNDLFEAIVTERQLELAFEGVRFLDLVRWGRAVQELGSLGFVAGKHELLPIPADEVNVAGLSQNAGY